MRCGCYGLCGSFRGSMCLERSSQNLFPTIPSESPQHVQYERAFREGLHRIEQESSATIRVQGETSYDLEQHSLFRFPPRFVDSIFPFRCVSQAKKKFGVSFGSFCQEVRLVLDVLQLRIHPFLAGLEVFGVADQLGVLHRLVRQQSQHDFSGLSMAFQDLPDDQSTLRGALLLRRHVVAACLVFCIKQPQHVGGRFRSHGLVFRFQKHVYGSVDVATSFHRLLGRAQPFHEAKHERSTRRRAL
mmetsp:Transcript_4566/g.28947  ORF Transcript_4566/g.28947 Transcript_4566/m.28947 type:complete len:244 (-) Transcript_4566:37-768(-)